MSHLPVCCCRCSLLLDLHQFLPNHFYIFLLVNMTYSASKVRVYGFWKIFDRSGSTPCLVIACNNVCRWFSYLGHFSIKCSIVSSVPRRSQRPFSCLPILWRWWFSPQWLVVIRKNILEYLLDTVVLSCVLIASGQKVLCNDSGLLFWHSISQISDRIQAVRVSLS